MDGLFQIYFLLFWSWYRMYKRATVSDFPYETVLEHTFPVLVFLKY